MGESIEAGAMIAVVGVGVVLCVFSLIAVIRIAVRKFISPRSDMLVAESLAGSYIPRGDRVVVKRLPRPEPPAGEMVIPGSQQEPLNEGTVVAVGPDESLSDISVGQHVCFLDFAGTKIEIDGEEYLSLRESEIHGVRK